MPNKNIYATYLLYNIIFIDNQLESDNFGIQEQQEITNIAHISFLAINLFLQNKDIIDAQRCIRETAPKKFITVILDTLQDLIALENNMQEIAKQIPLYTQLGKIYHDINKKHISQQSFLITNMEDFFSNTMIFFEIISSLDENDYHIQETIDSITDHEFSDLMIPILKQIQ